jgi:hypothetical protein
MISFALVATLLAGEELTTQKAAAVSVQLSKAKAEVEKKYGDKKAIDLTAEERRERTKDLSDAEKSVLGKNEVEPKEWSRYNTRLGRDATAEKEALEKAIVEKETADAAAAQKEKDNVPPTEIEIIKMTAQPMGPDGKPLADEPPVAENKEPEPPKPAAKPKKGAGGRRR